MSLASKSRSCRADTHKLPVLALVLDLDGGLVVLLDDVERPVLLVALDLGIVYFTADETLSVEDRVFGVRVVCVLGGISDTASGSAIVRHRDTKGHAQSLVVREADPRWGDTVTLVVCDNLYTTAALYTGVESQLWLWPRGGGLCSPNARISGGSIRSVSEVRLEYRSRGTYVVPKSVREGQQGTEKLG